MPEKKLTKCPNFTRFLPEKILFARIGGGATVPLPLVSYAYGATVTITDLYERAFDPCLRAHSWVSFSPRIPQIKPNAITAPMMQIML